MSQLTLFTDSRFPCPQRLQLVILELGLEIADVHQVDIMNREHKVNEQKYCLWKKYELTIGDDLLEQRIPGTQPFRSGSLSPGSLI